MSVQSFFATLPAGPIRSCLFPIPAGKLNQIHTPMTARCFVPLVSLFAALAPGLFAASPLVIPAEGGTVTLPLTGLSVVFPAREKTTLKVTASWSLQVDKNTFDSRDVIDEVGGPENDTIITGTWAHVGYFNAGGPAAVVAEAELKDAWPVAPVTLWGFEWQARGGKWDFGNELGIKPALVLAGSQPRARRFCYIIFSRATRS